MQNKPNFSKPKMVVTAVYTMTNNNEQRTTNYSKQTQTKPISQLPIAYCIPYGISNGRHSQLSPEVEDCGSRLGFSEWLLPVDIVFV
jgi:hypothetical protein